ncbi:MAG: 2-amino-4-hydroxy-6-hydroxymethyldihydropteridine diphosphokinase [Candidatus Kapaibacterium sp.]|nr:2-amino-4-hydroxy-6-hydroxymethyldihydropteridine diphosphokinase [Bacteroidota bacterium]
MKQTSILLSLGSNVGDRIQNLHRACNELRDVMLLKNVVESGLYETEPVGYTTQPDFINMCVLGTTSLTPIEFYTGIKLIEKKIGRVERPQWHEREIDIDILLYGDEIISTDSLTIPHPRMHERKFVLVPATEIAPDVVHPVLHKSISVLLEDCTDTSTVTLLE